MLRALLLTASLAAAALGVMPPHSNAISTENDIPFDTLGIVTNTTGINLYPPTVLRVRDAGDIESTRELLATGYDPAFAARVVAQIGDIPSDRVVLVGIIDVSCTSAETAGLVSTKDGDLEMYAPGHVPEPINCLVAVVTVAVLSVDADDAPPGSTDHADLVSFGLAGYGAEEPRAAEITADDTLLDTILPSYAAMPILPARATDDRRFAFVLPGCQNTTAELIVTPQLVDARLDNDEHGLEINCAQAEYFVAVFDVPADMVRDDALLVGAASG